ncbi:MAG: SUF system NifU family Fe-S cluster assembly protein [Ruminococcus sp.]|nr:SUF system NifU family Fe-S cluster assembly protein [Ruminococcus sp.]
MTDNFYGEVLTDHNLHPLHKHDLPCATCSHEGINPSCGDDIVLNLEIKDGVIVNGSYTGSGCAISQASADIMLELVIGKTPEEAMHYKELFMKMINGEATDEEIEELEEAGALQNVSKMPARVKCAVLGWRTMEILLTEK